MGLNLDFSGLDKIALQTAKNDFSEPFKVSEGKEPTGQEKTQNGANLSQQGQAVEGVALIKLKREQEDRQHNLEMYRDYQNNIRQSGQLQTEILKGIRAGEPAYTLLLKACKAISLMTGNKLFYNQTYKDLKAIYGEGLKEQIPLEWELDEVRERLANMGDAIKRESTDTDSRERIAKAIEAHRQRERELLELIGKEEVNKAI